MRVLILGGRGMAGHMMRRYFAGIGGYTVYHTSREKTDETGIYLDVRHKDETIGVLKRIAPDLVINCTGLLNEAAQERQEEAILVNSLLPHRLSEWGRLLDFKLVHISTDCVFSGRRGGYTEEDATDGYTWYAKTKALGEIRDARSLTFRTSIIGPELKPTGTGLFAWFMAQQGKVQGYSNVYWTGVTTLELAKAVHAAFLQDLGGLYHLVPEAKISKYNLLRLMKAIFSKDDVRIEKTPEPRIDKSLIDTRRDFQYRIPAYAEMLNELKEQAPPIHDQA
jgi:dTDP-4-dehydrorhamnose reductase